MDENPTKAGPGRGKREEGRGKREEGRGTDGVFKAYLKRR